MHNLMLIYHHKIHGKHDDKSDEFTDLSENRKIAHRAINQYNSEAMNMLLSMIERS